MFSIIDKCIIVLLLQCLYKLFFFFLSVSVAHMCCLYKPQTFRATILTSTHNIIRHLFKLVYMLAC
ncbi:hypothetical protein M441DRAFT_253734 [Trichoderma asperellum CBS 433.97]|uniref:Uncharacterized protein n=1 Tax=Trichoderma asperellum (strain ATCC 204424 / CBS 433.97 / NBRC 101777) TaxID=1042311 RepID=A0A2T3YYA6_TRIA4|nr:hypothetical protein M441DRAFT_253734 [Trichoderma asperellum CBS 433.97]PTB37549.1 hypothetical protein M441DRAFT_253734 [Trichoderma asperellum CBS 433.97]